MKRKIEFRAWDKRTNDMIHNVESGTDLRGNSFSEYLNYPDTYEVMQYINFNDINGNKLFEGDIVSYQIDVGDKMPFITTKVGVIDFNKEDLGWGIKYIDEELEKEMYEIISYFKRIKIIGNIYQNPKLLENQKYLMT